MRRMTPAGTAALVLTLFVLSTPGLALDPPMDGVTGTLEDYTAVNTGLPTTGEFLYCIAGDVNGDGFDDIVASTSNNSQQSPVLGLRVYTCKGGTGWEDNSSGLPTVDRYGGIGLGDVDGDGDLDIAAGVEIAEGSTTKGVTIWLNNGTVGGKLSWVEGPSPETTWEYCMVVFADINDDDDLDIVASTKSRGVRVWTGDGGSGGTLTWTAANTGLPTSNMYTGLTVADMNKDGDLDIVSCDYFGGIEVHLWTGDGTGSWTSQDASFPTGSEATMGCTVGDVNDDTHMDIVYGRRNNAVKCLLGNSGGSDGQSFCWTAANTGLGTSGRYSQVDLADADLDGDLDLIAGGDGRGLELYLGNGGAAGSMSWSLQSVGLPTGNFYGAEFADFNKDRVPDVVGSRYHRRGVGGLEAYSGTVTGASFPTARAVWNGTGGNATSVVLGQDVTLDGRPSFDAEDAPDGDVTGANLTYEWNVTRLPAGSSVTDADLSTSDGVATPTFTPDVVGNFTFTLAVMDTDAHWSIDEAYLELRVLKPNDAPVADAGPDRTVQTGDLVELNGTASYDPDGQVVGWEWDVSTSNPFPVTLPFVNGSVVQFTAPDAVGVYQFSLMVLDDNGTWSGEDLVNITVELPPNVLPVAVLSAEPAITLGGTVRLDGTASYDADGEIVNWTWNCTSHPLLVISGSGGLTADAVPTVVGTHVFTLAVQDDRGGWSSTDEVSVLVVAPEVNVPPVAVISQPGDRVMVVNSTILVDGSGSYDPDGELVQFLWNVTPPSNATFTGHSTSAIQLTALEEGDILVTLAVRDDNGSWSLTEATVTFRALYPPPPPPPPPENEPPVAMVEGPREVVPPGSTVVLDGSSSHDPDGDVVDWEWQITSHPTLAMTGLNTSTLSFLAEEEGLYTARLRVRDDNGTWSEAAWFTTAVEPLSVENRPPVVRIIRPAGGLEELQDDLVMVVEWEASDPDGDDLTFRVELTRDGDLLQSEYNLSNGTRRVIFPAPEDLDGIHLVVSVTALEADKAEPLGTKATSEPFWFHRVGVEPDEDDPVTVEEEFVSGIPWGLLLMISAVVMAVVAVTLLLVLRQPPAAPPIPSSEGAPPPVGQVCDRCGGPASRDNAFGQAYCEECDRFL